MLLIAAMRNWSSSRHMILQWQQQQQQHGLRPSPDLFSVNSLSSKVEHRNGDHAGMHSLCGRMISR